MSKRNLESVISDSIRALNLSHTAHDKATEKDKIADLETKIADLIKDRNLAINHIAKLTKVINEYNMVHTGKDSNPLVADTVELEESKIVVAPNARTEKYVMPSVTLANGKITLGQYDKVYGLYVKHPVNNQVILLNGLPDKQQKHYIGQALLPLFDGIKESSNIGSFRVIRDISTEETTGKVLTCGAVYRTKKGEYGKCKCNQVEPDNEPAELMDLLSGLETSSPETELVDYLDSLTETLSPLSHLDNAEPVVSALKGIPLWTATHNPALGTMVQWVIAKRARALLVQNGIPHKGFTKINYDAVTKIALTSGKIEKADLMK